MDKLEEFVKLTGKTEAEQLPTINQHYKDTAKLVDIFNTHLGGVKKRHRIARPELAIFWHSIKMVATNAWVLWLELNFDHHKKGADTTLPAFLEALANELLEVPTETGQ